MRKMTTEKGTWQIFGTNIVPSDSAYQKIKSAIEEDKLSQKYLQQQTGHLAPILIDKEARTIRFANF